MKFSPQKLNKLRRSKRLTYEALAALLRAEGLLMQFSSVWRHCSGTHTPTANTIGAYAKVLGVQVQDLYDT